MKKNLTFLAAMLAASIMHGQKKASQDTLPAMHQVKLEVGKVYTFGQLDQRKIYHWDTGQRATPSGRQAKEHVSNYARLITPDSAVVLKDSAQ